MKREMTLSGPDGLYVAQVIRHGLATAPSFPERREAAESLARMIETPDGHPWRTTHVVSRDVKYAPLPFGQIEPPTDACPFTAADLLDIEAGCMTLANGYATDRAVEDLERVTDLWKRVRRMRLAMAKEGDR